MFPRNALAPNLRQRGAALMLTIFLVTLAALTIFIGRLSSIGHTTAQQERAASALHEAKNGLLGYALTKGAPDYWGALPMPDMGKRDASHPHVEGESSENFTSDPVRGLLANSDTALLIGKFPSKTLGLPRLRDAWGNCLWYGISAAFKASNTAPESLKMRWFVLSNELRSTAMNDV